MGGRAKVIVAMGGLAEGVGNLCTVVEQGAGRAVQPSWPIPTLSSAVFPTPPPLQVPIEQPTAAQTISILRGLCMRYEKHHNVRISDKAIVAAATLSDRYIADRYLPDKVRFVIVVGGFYSKSVEG